MLSPELLRERGDTANVECWERERTATKVLFSSIIAAAVGAGLTMTGTPAIGFPMVFVAFPVVFFAFGIKIEWAVRRGSRWVTLIWDLLGRGSLLAFGVWITLEMGEAHRFERDLINHAPDGV